MANLASVSVGPLALANLASASVGPLALQVEAPCRVQALVLELLKRASTTREGSCGMALPITMALLTIARDVLQIFLQQFGGNRCTPITNLPTAKRAMGLCKKDLQNSQPLIKLSVEFL